MNLGVVVASVIGGQVFSGIISAWFKSSLGDADAGLMDRDYQASFMRAMPVIAAFSVFEAYVEDFTKGVMRLNEDILDDPRIQAVKVPLRELLAPEDEKLDRVYRALSESAGKTPGVVRYEDLLQLVGLSGDTPELVKDEFFKAQMVRHVWTHNAGIADAQFVRRTGHLGFKKGDLVTIEQPQSLEYIMATTVYGIVIANRHRKQCGLDPLPIGGIGTDGPVMAAFRAFYG